MNQNPDFAIDTQGLRKSYPKVDALKGLDLKVRRHSICGFLGPNGAGKTTTIKLLLGLIRPSGGRATIFGHDVESDSIRIRRRVGYLAQNPRYYPHMTARETLRFVAGIFYRGPQREIEQRIDETLGLVGLADRADRPVKGFSGGELQRLGIAQAQVNHPDLLILDEPAASLDPMGRRDVLDVMARLRGRTTIFYSTHILDDVQRVSDTVAILNQGELVAQAPIGELLGDGEVVLSITLKGDPTAAHRRVSAQAWVTGIEASVSEVHTVWQVAVSDLAAAETQLLPLILADRSVIVVDYRRRERNLEEAFMSIVEGRSHG